jgi:5-formyltetrahydrofolate cyclo-ligase
VADHRAAAKAALRVEMLAARSRMTAAARSAAGAGIASHVDDLGSPGSVAAYFAVDFEPPTQPLLERLIRAGVRVLLPVIDGAWLDWASYRGAQDLASGPLGIHEPTGERLGGDAVHSVDLVLAPALAADRAGHRLGRGRGYYDRALREVTSPVIAVLYDGELVDSVPAEPHDRSVDAVLRPAGLGRCEGLPAGP